MKKILSVILIIAIVAAAIGGAWQIYVRVESKKYDLITLDTSVLPQPQTEPDVDDFVQLSEVKMHYRIYGHGKQPLILIHGNGGSVKSLEEAASYLANDYTVYLPESRCHGQSSNPDEISYKLMASDFVEFAKALNIQKPLIMGHSDGGINAITIAAEYPDFPKAIISCGANSHPSKFKPYFTLGVMFNNLFHKDKLNDMMLELPDFTEDYLAKITCPTYVVAGEYDIMWLSDSVYIHNSIKGSDFSIIKSANHGSYMSHDGKQAYVLAKSWFEKIK
ncbi:MAG: alpha/beta hydrolase [Clostridia bacterium]|nr:alpha/beta hydrolase [Clostridia bacterium]